MMVKGLWQRKGIPGPGLGELRDVCKLMWSFTKESVQLQHNTCAKEENGIFTSSAFSVYDGDRSQAMLYSVPVYLDARACVELHRETYGVFVPYTVNKEAFVSVPTFVMCCGGDVGQRNRVAALIGKCMWYFG